MKNILPPTSKRVSINTCDAVNQKIRDRTLSRLYDYIDTDEDILTYRIKELDEEWDTERLLEARAAGIVLAASAAGYIKSKHCCFLMTGAAGLFLLQHALQGWCPPVPIIRKWGVRTADEIKNEQIVLKYLRGDFTEVTDDVDALLDMAEK